MQHVPRWSLIRAVTVPFIACIIGFIAFDAALDGAVSGIVWDAATPLTWDLFQATPPADAVHRTEAAAIHMAIRWHASYSVVFGAGLWRGQVQSVTTTNTMQPSLSWVVPGKADDRVLSHEQAHFDLNEVYRRKLEALLACVQAQGLTKESVIDALDAALHRRADEVLTQLQAAQARYDAATCHGNNPAGQAQWEAQIAAWLLNPTAAP